MPNFEGLPRLISFSESMNSPMPIDLYELPTDKVGTHD